MTLTRRLSALVVVSLVAMAAFIALQPADAAGFNERVSGNFIDTALDTNGDGMQANYFSGAALGNGGPTYEGLVEVQFLPDPIVCPAGTIEGDIVEYSIARRYSNGDLAFSRLVDGFVCFDPFAGVAELRVEAEVTGGTGKYADATGSYTAVFEIRSLVPDPMGGIGHGAFSGTTTG